MLGTPQIDMGKQGFEWFFGQVEDRDDPEKLGRVRVRIFNRHPENQAMLPTEMLHWASVGMPVTSASHAGIGSSPTGILKGSMVMGFFLDGSYAQQPVICFTWWGKPNDESDVSKFVDGSEKLQKGRTPFEPKTDVKPEYPYNKVLSTESGHVVEIDDTPGHERVSVYHKAGSYVEFDSTGDLVVRSVKDGYDLTLNNKTIYVGGNANVVVKGNLQASVKGTATIESQGDLNVKSASALTASAPSITISETSTSVDVNISGDETVKPRDRYTTE